MGVQRASRHWAVTVVLRENLDFFYDTTMAQTLLLYHRESLGAAESKIERQSKAKTNTLTLLSCWWTHIGCTGLAGTSGSKQRHHFKPTQPFLAKPGRDDAP